MRFLTDTELDKIKSDRAELIASIADKDEWMGEKWADKSLADLSLLKSGWEALIAEADKHIATRVNQGRFAGGSWAEVGKILGISRQAAQQKFRDIA